MAATTSPCAFCGAVLPLAGLLKLTADGEYDYVCQGCAVAIPPERHVAELRAMRQRRAEVAPRSGRQHQDAPGVPEAKRKGKGPL